MNKKMVAVVFGSRSAEHDVSIITAIHSVIEPLKISGKYEVLPVYIDKIGRWFADPALGNVHLYSSGKIERYLAKNQPVKLRFDGGLLLERGGLRKKTWAVDVVFPTTHGTYGEDGSLMGLLRMANVAFAGCDLDASVLAMDKVLARQIAQANDLKQNKFIWFFAEQFAKSPKKVVDGIKLAYPLFVKPAHLGSSIAITRVKNRDELVNAIEVACEYDDKILIEEAVPNLIEVTLPIMGTSTNPRPGLLERPLNDPEAFFDFDTKYMQGGGKKIGGKKGGTKGSQGYSEIPAKLPSDLGQEARKLGLAVYKALGCEGIARVDMLIDSKKGQVYFNEVNPLPGSLYIHNWKQAGVSNVELVEELIRLGVERHQRKNAHTTTFSTNFLQQF